MLLRFSIQVKCIYIFLPVVQNHHADGDARASAHLDFRARQHLVMMGVIGLVLSVPGADILIGKDLPTTTELEKALHLDINRVAGIFTSSLFLILALIPSSTTWASAPR